MEWMKIEVFPEVDDFDRSWIEEKDKTWGEGLLL